MNYLITAAPQMGPTLRGMRNARKMTQRDVAGASGLQQKTVSLLERHPQRCSVDSLIRYIGAVRVNIHLSLKADAATDSKGEW